MRGPESRALLKMNVRARSLALVGVGGARLSGVILLSSVPTSVTTNSAFTHSQMSSAESSCPCLRTTAMEGRVLGMALGVFVYTLKGDEGPIGEKTGTAHGKLQRCGVPGWSGGGSEGEGSGEPGKAVSGACYGDLKIPLPAGEALEARDL